MRSALRIGSLALCSLAISSALAAPALADGRDEDAAVRRINLSSNPLLWPYGYYGFTVGVALTEHLAVRGDVTLYSLVESDVHGHELSLGLPLYMRRAYQGPFLEPGFTTVHLENVPVGQVIATPLDG